MGRLEENQDICIEEETGVFGLFTFDKIWKNGNITTMKTKFLGRTVYTELTNPRMSKKF